MHFLRDSVILSYYKRTWPFSATVLSRAISSLGCYQGPRDMLLTLSPFAVDSLTPSYRCSQHPPRAPIPYHFSQLLQANVSYVRAHPGPRQYGPFSRPSSPPLSLSTHQHHLPFQTVHLHHVLYAATTD